MKFYNGNQHLSRANQAIQWTPHMVEEFLKCKEDPIYFVENYIKIVHVDRGLISFELYDYQREMILNMRDNRECAFCMSRQSGKSVTVVAFILWYIIFSEHPKEVGILANKGDTAREILGRVQLAYQHLPQWLKHGVVEWQKGSFHLENGAKVIAAATSSSNIRGKSLAFLYLDEVAFVENYDEFFASVYPTISSGKETKIVMTSTPNGLNHFYKTIQMAKQGENGFIHKVIPWHRVPGRDEAWKINTMKALNNDQQKFDQEFNCVHGDTMVTVRDKLTGLVQTISIENLYNSI